MKISGGRKPNKPNLESSGFLGPISRSVTRSITPSRLKGLPFLQPGWLGKEAGQPQGVPFKPSWAFVRTVGFLGGLVLLGILGGKWHLLVWAGESPNGKSSFPAPPQMLGPAPGKGLKTTGPNLSPASKSSADSHVSSPSCKDRPLRAYRYYYSYYGPYWPGYPWPYPPPPPPPWYLPYYSGPIFVDPDGVGYGPRSILRLMGVEHWFSSPPSGSEAKRGPTPGPNWPNNQAGKLMKPVPPAPKPPNQPNQNPPLILEGPEANAPQDPGPDGEKAAAQAAQNSERAMLLVDLGDAHFAHKKYSEALQRYREAVRLDAQLPEAHLHMGFALVALGKYAEAAQAWKRGLQLHPNWPASGFRLRVLYGPQEAERVTHRKALAAAVAANPHDADLLFLLGVLFYFDQMPEQARRAFLEAARWAGPNASHIDAFLGRVDRE